jgi:hypothetical protein
LLAAQGESVRAAAYLAEALPALPGMPLPQPAPGEDEPLAASGGTDAGGDGIADTGADMGADARAEAEAGTDEHPEGASVDEDGGAGPKSAARSSAPAAAQSRGA